MRTANSLIRLVDGPADVVIAGCTAHFCHDNFLLSFSVTDGRHSINNLTTNGNSSTPTCSKYTYLHCHMRHLTAMVCLLDICPYKVNPIILFVCLI